MVAEESVKLSGREKRRVKTKPAEECCVVKLSTVIQDQRAQRRRVIVI